MGATLIKMGGQNYLQQREQECDVKMIGLRSELSSHARREKPKNRDLPFLAHSPDVPGLHGSRTDTNGWSKLFAAERAGLWCKNNWSAKIIGLSSHNALQYYFLGSYVVVILTCWSAH